MIVHSPKLIKISEYNMLKKNLNFLKSALLTLYPLVSAASATAADEGYVGSLFSETWQTVQESPYETLPQTKVTFGSFFADGVNLLKKSSERTLNTQNDTIPYFRKLLHPNGICLAGTWNITEPTPYTGYFRQGSQGLIILRASAALSQIHRGEKRSFGIAGKIYPTNDPNHEQPLKTANFFVIDNLAGTYTQNFLDSPMTNDITSIAFGFENLGQTGILGAAATAFAAAEKKLNNLLTVRQLYQISELGEENPAAAVTPLWIKIVGSPGPRNLHQDFRDDLRLAANNGTVFFDIYVSSEGILGFDKLWTKIGYIAADQEAASEGCDHRLHFQHPKWRSDLVTK
jgi:hypothetical protein